MTIPPRKYNHIGIIGTGRVARAFAVALAPFSREPIWLHGRSAAKIAQAIEHVGGVNAPIAARSEGELLHCCDLILIAVSDDAIPDVAHNIAQHSPLSHAPLIIHPSGRCGVDVLEPLRSAGALTAAIHPVMTFTGHPAAEAQRMAGCSFAVSASSDPAQQRAMALVQAIGGTGFALEDVMRPLYHAALSHGANHLVTLLAGAAQALRSAGVDDPYAVMTPLVRAAVENSLSDGFSALSGPILRGDAATIAGHVTALDQHCSDIADDYRALARATVRELDNSSDHPPRSRADIVALLHQK